MRAGARGCNGDSSRSNVFSSDDDVGDCTGTNSTNKVEASGRRGAFACARRNYLR